MSDIYEEIEREWVEHYPNSGENPPPRTEFGDLCAAQETKVRGQTSDGLQPWLGILEVGIEWLTSIHVALDTENGVNRQRPCHRVTWSLVGAAVSFGLSLRTLCLSGFDTPARALLRSYVDALLLCLAVLHDEDLAQAYMDAQDDAQVKTFWHKRASPKNLHSLIIKIEKTTGFDQETIAAMTEYRRGEYEILSQSAHLSYAVSRLTSMAPVLGDPDTLRHAILGLATENSLHTLHYAAATTWYFSRLGYSLILGRDKCLLTFDKESDWQRKIAVGREVISSITMRHWEDRQ